MKIVRRIVIAFLIIMVIRCIVGCDSFSATQKNNEVEDELRIHAVENGYDLFIDYMESEMDEKTCEHVSKLLKEKRINQSLQTLKYSSVSGKDNYCYINGTYTIPYNVRLFVEWSMNIDVDKYNENFHCNRHYAVSDPNKEAFLLVGSTELGYRIVRIVPDSFEITVDVDFTREGFEWLCIVINNKKQNLLAHHTTPPVITESLLNNLYANEYDYKCVLQYAKKLSESDQQEIQEKIDQGLLQDGIITIQMNETSSEKYYTYENGVYTINLDYNIVNWTQNIEEITNTETSESKYRIANMEEEAYMLIGNRYGFSLVRFIAN